MSYLSPFTRASLRPRIRSFSHARTTRSSVGHACGSNELTAAHAGTFDRYLRYLMVAFCFRGEPAIVDHRALRDAALARDAYAAIAVLERHINACVDFALASGAVRQPAAALSRTPGCTATTTMTHPEQQPMPSVTQTGTVRLGLIGDNIGRSELLR